MGIYNYFTINITILNNYIHMKIFSGGHYYALCKNNNRWLKFNDDDIEFDVDPIDKNAYILLYKKKNCN